MTPSGIPDVPSTGLEAGAIVLGDTSKNVITISPENGVRAGGYWESQSLARGDNPLAEYSILRVIVEFSIISAPNFTIGASGNGGQTWTDQDPTGTTDQPGGIRRFSAGFNLTGPDPRIRIIFDSAVQARLHGAYVRMEERADIGTDEAMT